MMNQPNENPELPSAKDLAWALDMVLDGVKEHDLVTMTGLTEADCAKVFEIYNQVCKVTYPWRASPEYTP